MVSYGSTKLLTSLIRTTTSNAVLPRTSLLSITSNRINSSRPIISNNLNNFSLNKKNFSSSSGQLKLLCCQTKSRKSQEDTENRS